MNIFAVVSFATLVVLCHTAVAKSTATDDYNETMDDEHDESKIADDNDEPKPIDVNDDFSNYQDESKSVVAMDEGQVKCGNHKASSCSACPQGHGASWCNADCKWCEAESDCRPKSDTTCPVLVTCGNHKARTCKQCPQGNGPTWCNNDCKWCIYKGDCRAKTDTCPVPKVGKCKVVADVGFILDSSHSVDKEEYLKEKTFVKKLAAKFGISKDGTRASVVTFSSSVVFSIKFNQHYDVDSFNSAVDGIKRLGYQTRIDRALRLAQSEMYKEENGARVKLPKILILLTDGNQYPGDRPDVEDPHGVAAELRAQGISMIVIGIGKYATWKETVKLAGTSERTYSAENFDELIGGTFLDTLTKRACEVVKINVSEVRCKAHADIGFLLDSSGSVKYSYKKEKEFIKVLVSKFGISKDGSRASVVTFSHNARYSIKFSDHTDMTSFRKALDGIELIGYTTRLDRALRLTQSKMFKPENGARNNLPHILVILTDGVQTPDKGAEDPGLIAAELRKAGIQIIVVGITHYTNKAQLEAMAGSADRTYSAASFDELVSGKFLVELTTKVCDTSKGEKAGEKKKLPKMTSPKDCWYKCGEKGGLCASGCGKKGYCCRLGFDDCSIEFQTAADSSHHVCVAYIE